MAFGIMAAGATALIMTVGSTAAHAAVWTDQTDYSPGSVVTFNGDNSDGAGYQPGETIHVGVNGPGSIAPSCDATADGSGAWSCQITLGTGAAAIGGYSYTATGQASGVSQSGTFTDSGCKDANAVGTVVPDPKVHAAFTTSGNTATYTIKSTNESPSGGIPGLIEYCIYPGSTPPDSATASYVSTIGAWTGVISSPYANHGYFDFERPDGNPANLPFDGTKQTVGAATWGGGVPATQTLILHINDPNECADLYGGNPGTCFVLPGTNQDLTVSKTAAPSFTRTFTWGITKGVAPAEQNIRAGDPPATFHYTVSVTHDSGTDGAWKVTGTITVHNPNSEAVTLTGVTDATGGGGSCTVSGDTGQTIPANGDSTGLGYTCTYSSNPGQVTDTATATWNPTAASTPDGSASGSAGADFGSVSPTLVDDSVTVTDSLHGSLGTVTATDPSPKTFTYDQSFPGVPGTCTSYPNTATFTTNTTGTIGSASQSATVCVGEDLTVSKTAAPSFTRTFTWGITKGVAPAEQNIRAGDPPATFHYTVSVTHDSGTDSAWKVTGTITVHNPNAWEPVTLTGVTDATGGGGSCTVSGDTGQTIPANGDSTGLGYTCTYSSNPGQVTDTATATWNPTAASTPDGSASGSAGADFGSVSPTLVDDSVTVTDSLHGSLGTVTATDPSPKTFTYDQSFPGVPGTCTSYPNTATFTTNTTGTIGSASQSATVCVGEDLTVSKTANPSFTRTYNWSIAKNVDKTLFEQIGGTVTANYTVSVNQTGFTDGAWKVTGTITVHNPNDWEAITANVADAIDNGGSCTVQGGTGVSVPASGSVPLNYTCTYSSAPKSSGFTNTGTATWDSTAASTPDNLASDSVTGAFGSPTTTVNKTITVTDTFNGTTVTLGQLTATDATPFASVTYTYSHTVNVPTTNCVKYTNTATIVQTGQWDSKTVEVCGPAKTGALTMGFWRNKNGQGIIGGGASTGGVCNSGTWLRQYAPFQDLSSMATCAQVATYVTNVINAATASGPSMNAMLKGQMLATALDVYFSDPGLGGNKINAPAPIGAVKIDLTKICHMIDSSSGTGTCSGTYENVSSAFGGANSMTVSGMLTYAASQSNPGGSPWYGNVKATQQLAKDAFDAINNQVAFSP